MDGSWREYWIGLFTVAILGPFLGHFQTHFHFWVFGRGTNKKELKMDYKMTWKMFTVNILGSILSKINIFISISFWFWVSFRSKMQWKWSQEWSQKWMKNGWKRPTVNNPNKVNLNCGLNSERYCGALWALTRISVMRRPCRVETSCQCAKRLWLYL